MDVFRARWLLVFAIVATMFSNSLAAQVVPGYPAVVGEYLEVPGARAADTPPELNRVRFLRLRPARATRESEIEAVLIAQPGFASPPGAWVQLGSQLVTRADAQICPIAGQGDRRCALEVWIIDRRGGILEDTEGLRAAHFSRDPLQAIQYYWGRSVLTGRGTVPYRADGNYDALLGVPDARFRPLRQSDVSFLWDWGFETAAGDLDALIDQLPRKARGTNLFIAGHSQGGSFLANWAGRRGLGGDRGWQAVAGLVFLDGGPAIGEAAALQSALDQHIGEVTAIESGRAPRFGAELQGIQIGLGLAVRNSVQGVFYVLRPDQESIFPPSVRPAHPGAECFLFGHHLPVERCGGVGLRLTNRAHAGLAFDDDPLPGGFLQTPTITALGTRQGRLDFQPRPGTEGSCASPGPQGDQPPCPPSNTQIDPGRVYGWLDGGGRGTAGPDGPLNGWTSLDGGRTFTDRFLQTGPNPSSVMAYIQQSGYTPSRTNIGPVELRLPDGERRTIDSRVLNSMHWYQPRRYDIDLTFLSRFIVTRYDRDGIRYDVDKSSIGAPVFVAARERRENPFPRVLDYTAIGPDGTQQSPAAAAKVPFDASLDTSLYGHSDFIAADDSRGNDVRAGEPGSSLVADTLIDWMLARVSGTTKVPDWSRSIEDWLP